MKVLYFGDVFGKPGRKAVSAAIKKIHKEHEIDFTILCGENVTHGKGILPDMAKKFFENASLGTPGIVRR